MTLRLPKLAAIPWLSTSSPSWAFRFCDAERFHFLLVLTGVLVKSAGDGGRCKGGLEMEKGTKLFIYCFEILVTFFKIVQK